VNIEKIREITRESMSGEADLSYITEDLVENMKTEAKEAEWPGSVSSGVGAKYTTYGNSLWDDGAFVRWYADSGSTDRSGACGSWTYQNVSSKVKYGSDGQCDNGAWRYWIEISWPATSGKANRVGRS
jgi:hypothetical protein